MSLEKWLCRSNVLEEYPHVEDKPYCATLLPKMSLKPKELWFVSQTFEIVQEAYFIFNIFQWWRVWQDLSVSQMWESHSAASFRLIGSQAPRQKLFKYASNIQSCAATVASPAGLQTRWSGGVPHRQLWMLGCRQVYKLLSEIPEAGGSTQMASPGLSSPRAFGGSPEVWQTWSLLSGQSPWTSSF